METTFYTTSQTPATTQYENTTETFTESENYTTGWTPATMIPTSDFATGTSMNATTPDDGRNFRFENYPQRVIISTIVIFVVVVGLLGNVMVILAVVLSNKLQTRTNAFVVNLAVADLTTCLSAPFTVVALLSMTGWPLPDIVCALAAAIGYCSLACSIMNLAAISINRLVLITKPIQTYQSIFTPRKIAAMLTFTWLYPALVCSMPLYWIGKWGYSDKYKTCTQDTADETSDTFSLVASILIFPIPLITVFVCYFKIYRHIMRHMKKMMGKKEIELADTSSNQASSSTHQLHNPTAAKSFSKRQVQITKNLFYVVCAFVTCLLPFGIALTIPPSDPVIPWTGMFIIFNSAVNPVIYGFKHPHFKLVFRKMLTCRYHMIPEPSGCLRMIRRK